MRIIVGLGNPGSEYTGTRHNVGFEVLDTLASKAGTEFREGPGDYVYTTVRRSGATLVLAKPMSYVNNSGVAVKEIVDRYRAELFDILIVVDDFNLPLGTLRLRPKGSDGGHNGLASLIEQLASDDFPRLRCGIGSSAMPSRKSEFAKFVLSQFEVAEHKLVRAMVERAADAATIAASEGLHRAMNLYNGVVE